MLHKVQIFRNDDSYSSNPVTFDFTQQKVWLEAQKWQICKCRLGWFSLEGHKYDIDSPYGIIIINLIMRLLLLYNGYVIIINFSHIYMTKIDNNNNNKRPAAGIRGQTTLY